MLNPATNNDHLASYLINRVVSMLCILYTQTCTGRVESARRFCLLTRDPVVVRLTESPTSTCSSTEIIVCMGKVEPLRSRDDETRIVHGIRRQTPYVLGIIRLYRTSVFFVAFVA
jgi:hypothetical protein